MKIPLPLARRRARIEIIPLIDIIFFLLATFVMVSMSMVKNQGIKVQLPTAATSQKDERATLVTVTVTEHGSFYLNKEELSLDVLLKRMAVLKANEPETGVIINGDKRAAFEDTVAVLDGVRQMGINKVTIQTQRPAAGG